MPVRSRWAAAALTAASLVFLERQPLIERQSPLPPSPLGHTTLHFEPNRGQTAPEAQFLARGPGYLAFLTPRELVLRLAGGHAMRVQFAGAAPPADLIGQEPLASTTNYFVGKDPESWHASIPNFARVESRGLYPGIDLVYSAHGRQLELDWVLSPGADPDQVRLEFDGIDGLAVDASGALVLKHAGVELELQRPRLYQDGEHGRREVAGRYRVDAPRAVSFEIEPYDPSLALVIDPIVSYSSFLGGGNLDFGHAVAVDRLGAVYVAGQSLSTEFPTGAAIATDAFVAFVAKVNPAGTALEYVTFIGPTNLPLPSELLFDMMGLAIDDQGAAYVTGDTNAPDFPTVNAVQSQIAGGHDAYVVKLAPDGGSLVYSTYFGGSTDDWGRRLALDATGNVVIAGITTSTDLPTVAALQPEIRGHSDAFIARLDPTGSTLLYSTFFGGREGSEPEAVGDLAYGLALDRSGNIYLCGYTSSLDFPTQNPLQAVYAGGAHDAFVSKLAADGSALLYSTYLGGSAAEECLDIAVDDQGSAYVTGWTTSLDFAPGTGQIGARGYLDAFVTKLSPDGTGLVYSTSLGGELSDFGVDIAINARGEAHVLGVTDSPDFPLFAPVQATYHGGANDAFVAVLGADSRLLYSTFLGGSGAENHLVTSMGIALAPWGDVIVAGSTSSWDFPSVEPLRSEFGSSVDVFLTRISYSPQVQLRPDPKGDKRVLFVHLTNGGLTPRTVSIRIRLMLFNQYAWAVYPNGTVLTLAPSEARMVSSIFLPALLLLGAAEVHATLVDAASGAVLSDSKCVGYWTTSWRCSR